MHYLKRTAIKRIGFRSVFSTAKPFAESKDQLIHFHKIGTSEIIHYLKIIIMAKRVKEPDQPAEVPSPVEPDVSPPTTPDIPEEPDEPEVEPEEDPELEPEIEPDTEPEMPTPPPEVTPI
jgi:hypothetical protein